MYFEKILDYATYKQQNILPEIAAHLNLQTFTDTQPGVIYTLAADNFVVDVYDDRMQLIYVDPEIQSNLDYVNDYFNYFYAKKDFKTIYFLLRYLILCEGGENECDIGGDMPICACVMSNSPKVPKNVVNANNFNIFSHSHELHPRFVVLGNGKICVDGVDVVAENGNVFVDGERSGAVSFVYSLGCDLEFSYEFVYKN